MHDINVISERKTWIQIWSWCRNFKVLEIKVIDFFPNLIVSFLNDCLIVVQSYLCTCPFYQECRPLILEGDTIFVQLGDAFFWWCVTFLWTLLVIFVLQSIFTTTQQGTESFWYRWNQWHIIKDPNICCCWNLYPFIETPLKRGVLTCVGKLLKIMQKTIYLYI